jgi:hypothetical protein
MKELTSNPYYDPHSNEYGNEGFEVIHSDAKRRDNVRQGRVNEPLPNDDPV